MRRMQGTVTRGWRGMATENLSRIKWATRPPMTAVIMPVQIRNASVCFNAVFGENSNMKLWFIRVLLHASRLHP